MILGELEYGEPVETTAGTLSLGEPVSGGLYGRCDGDLCGTTTDMFSEVASLASCLEFRGWRWVDGRLFCATCADTRTTNGKASK